MGCRWQPEWAARRAVERIRADAFGRGAELADLDHPPVAADGDDPAIDAPAGRGRSANAAGARAAEPAPRAITQRARRRAR